MTGTSSELNRRATYYYQAVLFTTQRWFCKKALDCNAEHCYSRLILELLSTCDGKSPLNATDRQITASQRSPWSKFVYVVLVAV